LSGTTERETQKPPSSGHNQTEEYSKALEKSGICPGPIHTSWRLQKGGLRRRSTAWIYRQNQGGSQHKARQNARPRPFVTRRTLKSTCEHRGRRRSNKLGSSKQEPIQKRSSLGAVSSASNGKTRHTTQKRSSLSGPAEGDQTAHGRPVSA